MNREKSYFVYCPPKSNSHGHTVRDKNIKVGLTKVVNAIVENLNAKQNGKMNLDIYFEKGNAEELISAKNTTEKLNQFLGLPLREFDNTGFESHKNSVTWESNSKNIFDLLDYLEKSKNQNLLSLNNFSISQFYYYGTRESANGNIMFSIESGKLFVRLNLILPYSTDDKRIYILIEKLKNELPIKLNIKYFKILGLNKNKYSQWKLDEETKKKLEIYLK